MLFLLVESWVRYGVVALAVLYLSFLFTNVWVHLLITLLVVAPLVSPGKLGRLVENLG
jgi:hypothetical protein